eukprot:ctg_1092.g240
MNWGRAIRLVARVVVGVSAAAATTIVALEFRGANGRAEGGCCAASRGRGRGEARPVAAGEAVAGPLRSAAAAAGVPAGRAALADALRAAAEMDSSGRAVVEEGSEWEEVATADVMTDAARRHTKGSGTRQRLRTTSPTSTAPSSSSHSLPPTRVHPEKKQSRAALRAVAGTQPRPREAHAELSGRFYAVAPATPGPEHRHQERRSGLLPPMANCATAAGRAQTRSSSARCSHCAGANGI